jgi:YggT family protein
MEILCALVTIYILLFFVRMVLTWFPIDPSGPMGSINSFLFSITEPLMRPVRNVIPIARVGGVGLDLSSMVVIIGLYIVRAIVCSI